MKNIKISAIMIFALLLSSGLFAQRGRGHDNYDNHYKSYHNYSRVYVNASPRYSYHTGYQPYYRPYYRPVPVYHSVIRPYSYYRTPVSYVHFGPAFGFRLNVLPFGYSSFYVGPNPYYYNQGVYYRPYDNGGYEVVAPPLNATVKSLPSNAVVTVIDGQKYYQVGGTFYQEQISEDNKLSYVVVGTDGVINTGNDNADNNNNNNNNNDNLNATDYAKPSLGSRYDELPADSKVQVINQQKYFVSPGGVYYKEVIEGDKLRYEVTEVQ